MAAPRIVTASERTALDAAVAKARREGLEVGRAEAQREAERAMAERLAAARAEHEQEITRRDEAEARNRIEVRGAAFWRGLAKGIAAGVFVGIAASVTVGWVVIAQQEASLAAGATTALQGAAQQDIVDTLRGTAQ